MVSGQSEIYSRGVAVGWILGHFVQILFFEERYACHAADTAAIHVFLFLCFVQVVIFDSRDNSALPSNINVATHLSKSKQSGCRKNEFIRLLV